MNVAEIRDLDGPNLFLLEPAIKLEFATANDADRATALARLNTQLDVPASSIGEGLVSLCRTLHAELQLRPPATRFRELEEPGHCALAFGWSHRRFAMAIAVDIAAAALEGRSPDLSPLRLLLASLQADDRPAMITDAERTKPLVSVTGTNGKTTTTRLLAHIARLAGMSAGWSSTAGVFIDGLEVESGDYAGPSGARRILRDPAVDLAIAETARGGILLRGLAYQSNDVSVFTNVSADHLGLQGVMTVEGLAEVKSTVCKVTKSEGAVIVNADDPLVLAATEGIRARRIYVSRFAEAEVVVRHRAAAGECVLLRGGIVIHCHGEAETELLPIAEAPVTVQGLSRHMIENALCATAAALALGIPRETVVEGLRTFHNTPDLNRGRMNRFDVDGATVLLDFAHNDVGLQGLLEVATGLRGPGGRIIATIGTAGDRTIEGLQAIGRVAALACDRVITRETAKYQRGRSNAEMIAAYKAGAVAGGMPEIEVAPDELTGLRWALEGARPGDVVALMAQEQVDEQLALLRERGRPVD